MTRLAKCRVVSHRLATSLSLLTLEHRCRPSLPLPALLLAASLSLPALAQVAWPTGYAWHLGGKGQQMDEMKAVVKEVLGLAFFFSFLVLAVQFNSLRLPLAVFLAAPFCLAGIGYGLFLAGQPFGATVVIGVMIVLATNVNDGVLLIETAERLRAEGQERLAATRRAAELRLRPRLMITLPVTLGFVPLAFALESGGELLRPMAAGAIGGLLAAILVALYLVPVLYSLVSIRDLDGGSQDPAQRRGAGGISRVAGEPS